MRRARGTIEPEVLGTATEVDTGESLGLLG